ncbi:MAG TPA: M3 family oligoendopeptidase, partial [Sphaerochaeta sp.]|nr:M3 family oligoendopeptidase [Sphaerochaeta sp.]HQB54721.1 M3 family oligoendopeptidase [Sphaerochaeta sp.]
MQILTRSEQKTMDTWDLSALFESDAAWEAAVEELRSLVEEIPSYKGRLKAGRDSLLETMEFHGKVGILAERVHSYAFLNWASDTSNPTNVERASIASTLMTELGAAFAFFDPELLSIDEEVINGYLEDEAFEPYKVFIKRSLRYKAHVLSEQEERIMALQRESAQTPRNAFSDLTNIDFDFGQIGGKPLTQSTFSSFLMNEDRALRKKAYKQFYSKYHQNRHTLFRLYEGQVKQDIFRHTVRSYPSSREMSLFADDVPTNVYDRLIESVHNGLPVLHRYYELRKKILGVRNLAHWDVYVPLVSGIKAHTPYEEAVKIIGEALKPLGSDYVDTLTRGLTIERWVDRYENKGKRSGAFSSGSYTGYPYILMNYKEDVLRDLFTLAHEGGHSMHSYYSARN